MNTCQKLYILEKKSKIRKEFVQNHDFLEKFDFYDFNFSAFLEVYTCARPTSFYSYRVKKSKKFDFVAIFQKISTRDVFVRRSPDIRNFSMLKKRKFSNCDFWPRKCSKWPILVPGSIKNTFWAKTKILKFFDFWTYKNFKIFSFFVKIFKILIKFFFKSWNFFSFLWTGIQLLLLGLLIGLYSTCLLWLDEKIKRIKIPHFFDFCWQFFSNIFFLSVFFMKLPLIL